MSSNICETDSELGKSSNAFVESVVDKRFDVIIRFSSRRFFLISFTSAVRIKSFLIPAAKQRSNRHRGHLRYVS